LRFPAGAQNGIDAGLEAAAFFLEPATTSWSTRIVRRSFGFGMVSFGFLPKRLIQA
jgi:hypothetical protein